MRLQVGDAAPHVQLTTMHDTLVSSPELWQNHGLIISFLRHFG